jgi:hypothetical protein
MLHLMEIIPNFIYKKLVNLMNKIKHCFTLLKWTY